MTLFCARKGDTPPHSLRENELRQAGEKTGRCRGRGEQGVALIVAMALLLVAGISLAMDALSIYGKRVREDKRSVYALNTIKKTLIAHAEMNGGRSRLPCAFSGALANYEDPTHTVDEIGLNDCATGSNTKIGFLPWQALQLPPLRDGSGAPIWYVVSASCGLTVDGVANHAVVLFSPGKPVLTNPTDPTSSQVRSPAVSPAPQAAYLDRNYQGDTFLDDGNAAATTAFSLNKAGSKTFNDRGLGILCTEMPTP